MWTLICTFTIYRITPIICKECEKPFIYKVFRIRYCVTPLGFKPKTFRTGI
nr:MAG TPA: FIRST ZINC FINGER FROM THE FINGER, CCHC, PROTEIN INTERACTION [Caudoviricetes sp.]